MMKKLTVVFLAVLMVLQMSACKEKEKPELLFYIGITMVKPINELVVEFEEEHNCKIDIIQGGSQDLYDSLKNSQQGDLYMPGSYSYRKENLGDGLLLDAVLVGYNKAALMVAEGNPLGFTSDLSQLSDKSNRVVIGNSESGSVGNETKKVLAQYGNYDAVVDNVIYMTADSRKLTEAIADGDADICINWYATSVWDENKDFVDAITIDEAYAQKKMLILNLTSCSKYPELTKDFMAFASSEHGKEVFEKYGFLEEADKVSIDGVEFE